uniref:Carboxypeptidase Q n=1 Tax=Loa loa TaxID=7209 RepID=A0A1I7VLJ7_LOALO
MSEIESSEFGFGNDTTELVHYITEGDGVGLAYQWLTTLVDGFGHRMVGSDSLEKAIDFLAKSLKEDGFDDVHTEDVPDLPKWVRGDDNVQMIEPRYQRLNVLALGGSEPADVIGEVVVIRELDGIQHVNISGKIVVTAQIFRGYPQTVKYRRSVKLFESMGAIGVLIKSITPFSIGSPHAGSGAEGARIPAACLTIEQAEMIGRMFQNGERIVIRMHIKSHSEDRTTSRNLIFQITGQERPSEVVLLSAHLDSWDVGQGALDDGGGCAVVWNALYSLKQLAKTNAAFKPKRTIRGIFWTAEEQGFLGAKHYYITHKNDTTDAFYFVSETDTGAFKPENWLSHLAFSGDQHHMKRLDEIVRLLSRYNMPLTLLKNPSQGDVNFWAKDGIPSVNYIPDKAIEYYFHFHHTDGDYITIFKNGDLEYTASIFAVLGHVIANMDDWGNKQKLV